MILNEEESEMTITRELNGTTMTFRIEGSAGLRAVLGAYKQMNGRLKLIHVSEILMEVLEVTGLNETLTIE